MLPLAACGPEPAVERGAALFSDPRLSPSGSNVFTCSTCHPVTAAAAAGSAFAVGEGRYPAPSLVGSVERSPLWCGNYTYLLDAVNACLVEFMRGERLSSEDERGRALLVYLRSLTTESPSQPSQTCTIVRIIDDRYMQSLPAGDKERGSSTYRKTCQFCHGDRDTGRGRLGERVSILPGDTLKVFGDMARPITAEKIRHGKFFGISGIMPFYSLEALSNAELADVLAYLVP